MNSILIVDDETITRHFLKANIPLWCPGWEVRAAAMDGEEAWELMQQTSFDLVMTDIRMPEMNGLELCRRISESFPRQKIVILSGYDEFSYAQQAMQYGVHHYQLKPIMREQLSETLNKIAEELDRENLESLSAKTIRSDSEAARQQVVKQFLYAVISGNQTEVKTLYPLIFRFKVQLIRHEAALMLFTLDEHLLLNKQISEADRSIYPFILRQMTEELAVESELGTAFTDHMEYTCVLIAGSSPEEITNKAQKLYADVSQALLRHTGLTVTAAISSSVQNILQLDQTYDEAQTALQARLLYEPGRLYRYESIKNESLHGQSFSSLIESVMRSLAAIRSALNDPEDWSFMVPLRLYVKCIFPLSAIRVQLFGIIMIRYMTERVSGSLEWPAEAADILQSGIRQNELTENHVLDNFRQILQWIRKECRNEARSREQDMVSRAKSYICSHYAEPLSLDSVAEQIGVSPAYLSSLFSQRQEEGYIKFLTRIRMEEAARLLGLIPRQRVQDIAVRVGYASSKHFSHVFKQHFGMPPGEYQERRFE